MLDSQLVKANDTDRNLAGWMNELGIFQRQIHTDCRQIVFYYQIIYNKAAR